MSSRGVKQSFLALVGPGLPLVDLFEHLPGVCFWLKDSELRFVTGTQSFVQLCGKLHEDEIMGKTDLDMFPAVLADKFRDDDREVFRTGEQRLNLVELIPGSDGTVDWYSTNKFPVRDAKGKIIGVAGTTRLLRKSGQVLHPYRELAEALDYISQNLGKSIEVRALAKLQRMSISQLERRFKELFQITPAQYIIKVRLTAACRSLATSREGIARIAIETGFYDASHFCRVFAKHMGITPTAYRTAYLQGKVPSESLGE